ALDDGPRGAGLGPEVGVDLRPDLIGTVVPRRTKVQRQLGENLEGLVLLSHSIFSPEGAAVLLASGLPGDPALRRREKPDPDIEAWSRGPELGPAGNGTLREARAFFVADTTHPLAGKPAPVSLLANIPKL